MDRKEFSQIAKAIKTYYPSSPGLFPNMAAVELWYTHLQDIPYQVCTLAVNQWVATNKWPPTIADLRESAMEVLSNEIPDWSEAWEEVMKNIQRYGFYRAVEGKEALSDLTRKTVDRIGYIRLCNSENITADRANFRDIYNSLAQRERKQSLLPAVMQEAIEITRRSMLEMKGEKNE
jgi:hypothetical protein